MRDVYNCLWMSCNLSLLLIWERIWAWECQHLVTVVNMWVTVCVCWQMCVWAPMSIWNKSTRKKKKESWSWNQLGHYGFFWCSFYSLALSLLLLLCSLRPSYYVYCIIISFSFSSNCSVRWILHWQLLHRGFPPSCA